MTHVIHDIPFVGAFFGSATLFAQATLPSDFESWPITAMLCFLVIVCLVIIYRQSKASSDASVATARALTELVAKQMNTSESLDRLAKIIEISSERDAKLTTIIEQRPCVQVHQHKPKE